MKSPTIIFAAIALLSQTAPAGDSVATNAAEVFAATLGECRAGVPFEFTATVTYRRNLSDFGVEDPSGLARLHVPENGPRPEIRPGDRIRVRGRTIATNEYIHARCDEVRVLAHGVPSPPKDVSLAKIAAAGPGPFFYDNALVRIRGTISDVFRDDIDTRFVYIVLCDGPSSVCATWLHPGSDDFNPERLIGRKASATGICYPPAPAQLRQSGRSIQISDLSSIVFTDGADADPFTVTEMPPDSVPSAFALPDLERRRIRGTVIAVWQRRNVMLRTGGPRPVQVRLIQPLPPEYGREIEVSGFPETDLLQITLSRAVWRPLPGKPSAEAEPLDVTAARLMSDGCGNPQVNPSFNGRTVRLTGRVASLPAEGNGDGRLHLASDGFLLQIDSSSCPDALRGVSVGCTVEVSGTCVTETEFGRAAGTMPRVKSNTVVLRKPSDVRVVAEPPWWTPGRLLMVIAALALLVIGFVILSEIFRRRAERRGKELAEESVRRAEADFRIYERTRLAVELHDSIAQSLSGVSLEIDTAGRFADVNPPKMHEHLSVATRALQSCREELRNCIWDLRNHALELDSVDEAIRQTVESHIGDTRLLVRFNVPRERISDNTMHTILKIIRELASNAVRHGRASVIRVAGSIEGGKLLFSVRDDGRGFDPATAPGMDQGHFGLQGVRERIESLEGEMDIQSAPSAGTRVTIAIRIPQETST